MLADTGDLAWGITGVLAGAHCAGADPAVVTSLASAARELDVGAINCYDAGIFKPGSASTSPSRSAVRLSLCRTPARR